MLTRAFMEYTGGSPGEAIVAITVYSDPGPGIYAKLVMFTVKALDAVTCVPTAGGYKLPLLCIECLLKYVLEVLFVPGIINIELPPLVTIGVELRSVELSVYIN